MTDQALRPELSQGRDYSESAFFNIFKEIPAGNLPGVAAAGATPFGETLPYLSSRLKRTMDILLVLCAAPLAVVLAGLAALAIKLNSRGPVFFVQERLGRNGVPFPCYKLRTMVVGAEQGTPQWAADNDPRVTRVGRFLRRHSLDELPQLVNVISGEMSLVGPRPELPWMVERYEGWQRKRFAAPPGIWGFIVARRPVRTHSSEAVGRDRSARSKDIRVSRRGRPA